MISILSVAGSLLFVLLLQEEPPSVSPANFAGYVVNSGLVFALVQLLKVNILPALREKAPWALTLLAIVIGPAIAVGQTYLSGFFGVPIDLTPLGGILGGATAVAGYKVGVSAFKHS